MAMYKNNAFELSDTQIQLGALLRHLKEKDLHQFKTHLNELDLCTITKETTEGFTLMQHAVRLGVHEFVASLLSANVDVNVAPGKTDSPILLAAEYGHLKILKLFLARPASRTTTARLDVATDAAGENVLHLGW